MKVDLFGNCTKRRFDREHEAKKAGRSIGLRAYLCDRCPFWHLTSLKKKRETV